MSIYFYFGFLADKIRYIFEFCYSHCRPVYKHSARRWTGNCELERICNSKSSHDCAMTMKFSQSLYLSKQLKTYRKIIFYGKPFSVGATVQYIVTTKNIDERKDILVMTNIKHCLHALRLCNTIQSKLVDDLQKLSFDKGNDSHNALLETLWSNMKPGMKRSRVFVSEEWGELGFQGKDPTTDFRGMGMLGLQQLLYFSEKRPASAIRILTESHHPVRYFPYATVGINFSAFVMELFRETRMHSVIFKALDRVILSDTSSFENGPSTDSAIVSKVTDRIHDVYCDIFEMFVSMWVERNPSTGVMAFPAMFEEIKAKFRASMRALG